MSFVKIIYRLSRIFYVKFIVPHYNAYINVFVLVHLSVSKSTSIGLALVCFTLMKDESVSPSSV